MGDGSKMRDPRVYNILPIDNDIRDPRTYHAGMLFPEVKEALRILRHPPILNNLILPPGLDPDDDRLDLLDWIGLSFGFQADNVRNQREHLVLLLANGMMQLESHPSPPNAEKLRAEVIKNIRKKVTGNYVTWCRFIGEESHQRLPEGKHVPLDPWRERRELAYTSLFLLIWGEAANLRFMPECLCFIYHNMLAEMNIALDRNEHDDYAEEQLDLPTTAEPNGFLTYVVVPLYKIIKEEADSNNGGKAPHSSWRNYDDLNEYFWTSRCFNQLGWPLKENSNFLVKPKKAKADHYRVRKVHDKRVGKTGFVEQRSFWYIFRSFDRLWIGLILVLQASIITLWHNGGPPWIELQKPDPLARFLSIFITWALLRFLQALLDFGSQYSLVSSETYLIGARMVLKLVVAAGWSIVFIIFYRRMWWQRNIDQYWTVYANNRLHIYLYIAAAFVFPEVLAIVLFILPWVRNFIETSNWKIFHILTWWFQTRIYVGRGLREGVADNLKYTLFWLCILVSKFAFSYWLQIRPLIAPTKEILSAKNVTIRWHEFFPNGGRAAIVALWAPVLLIYFMDVQIWYSIWSSGVGAFVGLLQHLGEIRNVEQLRLRFKIFPTAFQFSFMPVENTEERSLWQGTMDLFKRIKLRYGWSAIYEKVEWGQIEGNRFAHVWNNILQVFREEDLISDRELELLEFPEGAWRLTVFPWPSALLSNQILLALHSARYYKGDDKSLWYIICKSEYRRCAVIECYEGMKNVISRILKEGSPEHDIFINVIFKEIDASRRQGRFTETFKLTELVNIHNRVLHLIDVLLTIPNPKHLQKVVDALQHLYEGLVRDFPVDDTVLQMDPIAFTDERRDTQLFMEAVELPATDDEKFFKNLKRLHTTLATKDPLLDVPKGLEARRRISFFSNSLFMTMPRAPLVERMVAFSVLTPYYNEDVMFSTKQLKQENEDGVSILYYLQKIYPGGPSPLTGEVAIRRKQGIKSLLLLLLGRSNSRFMLKRLAGRFIESPEQGGVGSCSCIEDFFGLPRGSPPVVLWQYSHRKADQNIIFFWIFELEMFQIPSVNCNADDWLHFLERMKTQHDQELTEAQLWERDEAYELRLWASYRGQTLARTVRGMMYYERALEVQAFLDTATEEDLFGIRDLLKRGSSNIRGISESENENENNESDANRLRQKEQNFAHAAMKFTYVVTCQIYGAQKRSNDPAEAAHARDIFELMKTNTGLRIAYVDEIKKGANTNYYSVLVKYDLRLEQEVEIYRIQLPGRLKLGEGKPENQNHAIIFTRGEGVQTIDMNQEMYFEEAIKVRNLLQEFTRFHGIRKPTILGVREHVFTGSVSSLAWFMSAQETVFVTLSQRILANPLKIRMHYGHPDVFDRLWFMGRGGISKASQTINISEDIFAGFNCTLRGGTVTHHEYIQAGKGRDVGLNQIANFEAKVASGNGEQMLSRDVYRLGHHLDFFRMLSFYYTSVGFFVSNMLVVLTVYTFLWGRVYLALSGIEKSLTTGTNALANAALTAALNQQLVVQLGLLTALPMLVEDALEHGFTTAMWNMITMQLQLASVFFTFSMGTRCHYFGRTILHGGAKYRATGRGFVVKHEKFADNYRLYSRSHFVKGIELLLLLFCYLAYGVASSTATYIIVMISSWFLALTWIMAPFVFNPSGFDWLKTVEDFGDFMQWLWFKGDVFVRGEQSWAVWWEEEQEHFRTTGVWGKLLEIILNLRFFLFQYGIVYHLKITGNNTNIYVYLASWSYMVAAAILHLILSKANERYAANKHGLYRSIQVVTILVLAAVIVVLWKLTKFRFLDILASFLAFLPTGWGLIQLCLVLRRPFLEQSKVWDTVKNVARLYDLGMGLIVMAPVAFLSWLPGFQSMQTRILYNEAFSRGLQLSRILVGKKATHDD